MALLLRVLYWLAVVAISLAILVALVVFFESRDESTLEPGTDAGANRTSLVKAA